MSGKTEAENLMNELFDFAEKMLRQYGEFHPFGGYQDNSKHIVQVGVDVKDSHDISEGDRLNLLINKFKLISQKKAGVAFGLVTNVELPREDGGKKDAIKFFLEHEQGYCAEVFFEYNLTPQRTVEIVETSAQAGIPMFFD